MDVAKQHSPDYGADQSAMVAHAGQSDEMSVAPRPENHPRMRPIIRSPVVEQHGKKTGADQKAAYGPKEQAQGFVLVYIDFTMSRLIPEQHVCDAKCDDIHESVPSDGKARDNFRRNPSGEINEKRHEESVITNCCMVNSRTGSIPIGKNRSRAEKYTPHMSDVCRYPRVYVRRISLCCSLCRYLRIHVVVYLAT